MPNDSWNQQFSLCKLKSTLPKWILQQQRLLRYSRLRTEHDLQGDVALETQNLKKMRYPTCGILLWKCTRMPLIGKISLSVITPKGLKNTLGSNLNTLKQADNSSSKKMKPCYSRRWLYINEKWSTAVASFAISQRNHHVKFLTEDSWGMNSFTLHLNMLGWKAFAKIWQGWLAYSIKKYLFFHH